MRKSKFSPEVIERAVRMVAEGQPQHESQWAAIDLGHSQKPLAHKNRETTEHYVRARTGEGVKPLQ